VHFLLPLIRRTKVISVIHSDQYDYYRIANINNKYVDQWVAPSPRIKEGFLEYTNSPDKIIRTKIIPHGIDHGPKIFRGFNNGTFRIAYVGSLYKHKGVDLLVEIFKHLLISCPNIHFTIIGGGELESTLVEECSKGEITGNITLTGVIPAKQVREELLNTDVLLFPSRLEAFGLVIVEAMMEGAVPVVTLLPGVTDSIVDDGITGFLVEKNNINDFTNRLKQLYNNRDLLNRMSIAAIIAARQRFSSVRMSYEYDQMLNSL
jgi:glycosyltransferase involved in cell wall biosynthesis